MDKNKFIILFNSNIDDSEEFAEYYLDKHKINSNRKIGIDCDSVEVLDSEFDFNSQILNPLINQINGLDFNVHGIISGYRVPGGFINEEDIISTSSRLSRINHSFSKKSRNKLYDRRIFKRFSEEDSDVSLICSRIDAPNLVFAKNIVDNGQKVLKLSIVNGRFYIDPYSNLEVEGSQEYEDSMIEFKNNFLPNLNIPIFNTIRTSSLIDASIPFVQNDSFVWSWFSDRATNSFFRYSNALRVFFYNADYDGAMGMRDLNNNRWPFLSLNNNYACSAGAMSNPSIGGFLNITSFFRYLSKGATIGESYLFSLPYLDWTMTLFGDPLVKCSFPNFLQEDEDEINNHLSWKIMSESLEKSVASLYKKEKELDEIVNLIIDSNDPDIEKKLLYLSNDLHIRNKGVVESHYKNLVDVLFDFPRKYYSHYGNSTLSPSINNYLLDNKFKVSKFLSEIYNNQIEDNNLKEEGEWDFTFELKDYSLNFIFYHFILQVSDKEDFSDILIERDSISIKNWFYEKEKWEFSPINFEGVSTSYVGRKVKYVSQKDDSLIQIGDRILKKGETYYFKIIQYSSEDPSLIFGEDNYTMIISN